MISGGSQSIIGAMACNRRGSNQNALVTLFFPFNDLTELRLKVGGQVENYMASEKGGEKW